MSSLDHRFLIRPLTLALVALMLAGGCAISDRTRRGLVAEIASHLPPPERPIVIVPGFGQTRLLDPATGVYVWGTAHTTIVNDYPENLDLPLVSSDLELPRDSLVPSGYTGKWGPVDFAWNLAKPLVHYAGYDLQAGRRSVYFFEYDWRLGSDYNARRLDEYLEHLRVELHDPDLRFDIVGHSLGAMVVTTWMAMGDAGVDHPEEWRAAAHRARDKADRVVLIANPSGGVIEVVRFLARGERFVRREISPETVATFPIVYELLPDYEDLFVDADGHIIPGRPGSEQFWKLLRLDGAGAETARSRALLLARAREIRRAQRINPPEGADLLQIGGDCMPTARRVLVRRDGRLVFTLDEMTPSEKELASLVFVPGDGSVSRDSATRFESERVILCDGHHALTSDPDVHRALLRTFVEERGRPVGAATTVAAHPE